jgi:hypothetical protein
MASQMPSGCFQSSDTLATLADLVVAQHHQQPDQHLASLPYETPVAQSLVPNPVTPSGLPSSQSHNLDSRLGNAGPGSLSNAKSIPLLKLRQRQYAESLSQLAQDLPIDKVFDARQSDLRTEGPMQDRKQGVSIPIHSSLKPNQTSSARVSSVSEEPLASTSTSQAGMTKPSSNPSPGRRRLRKGGKHAQPNTSVGQSESPQKENSQVPKESDTGARKPTPRHSGRRKNSQRSRSDSLPQNPSRG